METAFVFSQRSTCHRLHTGCVLTDPDHQQLWVGYNGGPRGGKNECRRDEVGRCGCAHAEMNAVVKAPQGPKVAYATTYPCEMCATLLVNSGVIQVYFAIEYRSLDAVEVFMEAGVSVTKLAVPSTFQTLAG